MCHQCGKWTFFFSFCASTVTSLLLFTLSICPAGIISSFSHSLFTAAFASLFCDAIVMISRKSRFQTLPCRFVSFHNTRIPGFLVWVSVSTRYSFPQLLETLSCPLPAGHLSVFEHCRVLASQLPTLAVLAFGLLLTCQSKTQGTVNLVWQLLGSSSSAPRTTYILEEASHSIT